ncbi:hypothetical protein SEUCBS139899_005232 [Sporothrix eucalyptigena]|uniref:Ribosomal protein s17 n=1 Tax=Sporothrix eucalyptigena TaxID=1812306 RepID=A0ABP0BIF9_9PEZI
MMFKSALVALGSIAALTEASAIKRTPTEQNAKLGKRASSTCLDSNAVQTGSFVTGQLNDVPSAGQSNSETDTANFINFCSGQTLTNGLQVKTGSCNGIVMGKIPATTNMVSTVILNPKLNDNLDADTTFNVTLTVANLNLGVFTNATSTYYSAPQDIESSNGNIIGHTHVTIQNVGSSFQFTTPLDATQFVFFKGIDDAGNGQGTVTTAVTGGLPAGNYRVCSLSSSANHQPVLMPVAQRGAQDDCRYFTVGGSGSTTTSTTTTNNAGTGSSDTTTSSSSTTTSSSSSGKKKKTSCSGSKSSSASANAATAVANNASSSSSTTTTTSSSSSSAIGGIEAPAVTDSGNADRPFEVNGDTFVNKSAAIQRACSIQNNACANAVNSGQVTGFTVGDCNTQEDTCNAQSS